jgi:hypothetical protein
LTRKIGTTTWNRWKNFARNAGEKKDEFHIHPINGCGKGLKHIRIINSGADGDHLLLGLSGRKRWLIPIACGEEIIGIGHRQDSGPQGCSRLVLLGLIRWSMLTDEHRQDATYGTTEQISARVLFIKGC